MKRLMMLAIAIFMIAFTGSVMAQSKAKVTPPAVHGPGFVDKNGDGFNDNAPDHDGDGIPNGVDPDYKKNSGKGAGFVDANGDGVNDNAGKRGQGRMGKGQRGGKGGCKNQTQPSTATPPAKS